MYLQMYDKSEFAALPTNPAAEFAPSPSVGEVDPEVTDKGDSFVAPGEVAPPQGFASEPSRRKTGVAEETSVYDLDCWDDIAVHGPSPVRTAMWWAADRHQCFVAATTSHSWTRLAQYCLAYPMLSAWRRVVPKQQSGPAPAKRFSKHRGRQK